MPVGPVSGWTPEVVEAWEEREQYFRKEVAKLREWYETAAKDEAREELEIIYRSHIASLEREFDHMKDVVTRFTLNVHDLPFGRWLYKRLLRPVK